MRLSRETHLKAALSLRQAAKRATTPEAKQSLMKKAKLARTMAKAAGNLAQKKSQVQ